MKCYKCGAMQIVKNGKVFGWQRYKCKSCGYQFTKTAPSGKPMHLKLLAHNLYAAGFSTRKIAQIIGITAQSVSRWINKWHTAYETEQGNTQIMYEVNAYNILDCMNIKQKSKCILLTNFLPSGAKVHIVIELSEQNTSL
ncbi:MAG: IS1 family transposase [Alphaproteobacteria bacterium]|nr:IS1 family transposase [Alphaproteobacteria bacterium]